LPAIDGSREQTSHDLDEISNRHRFGNARGERVRGNAAPVSVSFVDVEPGHEHDGQGWPSLAGESDHVDPIHVRQSTVHQQQIGVAPLQESDRFVAVCRRVDGEPIVRQKGLQRFTRARRI
jgi:hypothetical protein